MKRVRSTVLAIIVIVASAGLAASAGVASAKGPKGAAGGGGPAPTTPIQHLVVIYQENVSFDHYFATYPTALNPSGEPGFTAAPGSPSVNGLSDALLTNNPNLGNPHRLGRSEALTCDQGHDYTPEQSAFDHGAMDKFVQDTGEQGSSGPETRAQCDVTPPAGTSPNDYAVMDYFDGNTVTALWNYAQAFAMSDNSYSTTFGPSTPGALNVVAANTYPVRCASSVGATSDGTSDPAVYDGHGDVAPCPGGVSTKAPAGSSSGTGTGTVVGDPDPYYDTCSSPTNTAALGGTSIGERLSGAGISWGFFQGGFASPGYVSGKPSTDNLSAVCTSKHYNIGASPQLDGQSCTPHTPAQPVDTFCVTDYSPHHQPFQYYPATSNPQHLPPMSLAAIGSADQANHQYDIADFWAAESAGNLPAVSYLKAPKFQDGHAGYSDPLDEQTFLVDTLNALQKSKDWKSTAVVIAYDDSDGWYDHVMGPVLAQSQTGLDTLTANGQCGANSARVPSGQQARCGLGPRQPLLVISPFARSNFVDHSLSEQASVVRFIEDNWALPALGDGAVDRRAGSLSGLFDFSHGHGPSHPLMLDPSTGEPQG